MQTDSSDTSVSPSKKKSEKTEASDHNLSVRLDKKPEVDDPKPRIVLTFRSEKPGAKSTMKIVSNEEKHEEVSPRRTRNRVTPKWDSDDEALISPKKDKSVSQPPSENDDVSDSSNTNLKRSTRHRNKETDVMATAIARKEKPYTEAASTSTPTQRLSRRIKPTAKILANEELRIGMESQNNARLGIMSDKSPEEGVRTRRSARRRSVDMLTEDIAPKTRASKRSHKQVEEDDDVLDVTEQDDNPAKEKKLKHLCGLGLKEKSPGDDDVEILDEGEEEPEVIEDDDEEEELDDETEVINKLLEDDQESASETSGDEYCGSEGAARAQRRRSTRLCPPVSDSDVSSLSSSDDKPNTRRRSSRKPKEPSVDIETANSAVSEESVNPLSTVRKRKRSPVAGAEGSEAACPDDETKIIATCFCETETNMYPAPDELEEPVFCQAVESVESRRVGCSHGALGSPGSLRRAGPRSPYMLLCATHTAMLNKHMCCPACGLFCAQGTFYQCSSGHLFHLDCGVPYNDSKQHPGCPHCGFYSYQWQPVNRDTVKVNVQMNTSNKRIYLPVQRIQCTPSYLTFSKLPRSQVQLEPVIPADLLPMSNLDVKKLLNDQVQELMDDEDEDTVLDSLCDAIEARETIEQLVPKICRVVDINRRLPRANGGTCMHVAARGGHVTALHALHAAGASLDAADDARDTPLLTAIHELCDKQEKKEVKTIKKQEQILKVEKLDIVEDSEEKKKEKDEIKETKTETLDESTVVDDTVDTVIKEKEEEVDGQTESILPASDDTIETKMETNVTDNTDIKPEDTVPEVVEHNAVNIDVRDDLLEEDSDTELKEADKDGASEEDLIKVVKYLVAAGCDVNYSGAEGLTALHIGSSNIDVCRVLVSCPSVELEARDLGGWTPLVWRLENNDAQPVRLLLEAGADPRTRDSMGNSAIHWAALHGAQHCLQLLLDAQPGLLHEPNEHTDTPLHVAARQGHYACVIILLARGAKTDVENSSGELPVDVCSGECQAAIAVNMQLSRNQPSHTRIISHDISNGREEIPVPCVNSVDDETLPDDFVYVTQHVMPTNIVIDNTIDTLQGCSCVDACTETCACVQLCVRAWWSRGGTLRRDFPHHEPPMLFDCNHTCNCNPKTCKNQYLTRQTRRGSMFAAAQVYREGGARGWGVRAAAFIPRGAVVALYTGELLSVADADSRTDDHYMFALDVKPDLLEQCAEKSLLCIDAGRYGGAARFINHSCRANLAPVRAYTAVRDLRLPVVALHAVSDIQPMEPLTFDYGDKFWSVKNKWMKCECDTAECRYPTIAAEEND